MLGKNCQVDNPLDFGVNEMGLEMRLIGLKSHFCTHKLCKHELFIFPSLCFLICKVGLIIMTSKGLRVVL